MILPMGAQGLLFLFICLLGVGFGLLYDALRLFMRGFKLGFVSALLGDLLFWALAAGIVFYLLLGINYGEVRLYMVLGIALGMVLYYNTLSPVFIGFITKTAELLKKLLLPALRPVINILLKPVFLIKFKLKKGFVCGIIRLRRALKKHLSRSGGVLNGKNKQ